MRGEFKLEERFCLEYRLDSKDKRQNKSSKAWDVLFEKYHIVREVEQYGYYDIKTNQMMRNGQIIQLWQKKYPGESIPDNRNILKFDFSADLPNIFKGYKLQIMPIGNNTYRIAPFDMYHALDNKNVPIRSMTSPIKIASLNFDRITTEPNAQTVAETTGMLAYIFHDLNVQNKTVVSTLSGKNNVNNVNFSVKNVVPAQPPIKFNIDTWQSEIDGVYESEQTILIIESKMKFPKDFNVRQLFIPRLLIEQIMDELDRHKEVYTGYFVKTKALYIFTLYKFTDLKDLNSIEFQKQYKFRLSDDPNDIFSISDNTKKSEALKSVEEVKNLISRISLNRDYPTYSNGDCVSFPQANNLQVALDYLDFLDDSTEYKTSNDELVNRTSKEAFVDVFKYDKRQCDYYLNWLGYFGLVDRDQNNALFVTETGHSFKKASLDEQNYELIKVMAQDDSSREALCTLLDQRKVDRTQLGYIIQREMKDVPPEYKLSKGTLDRRISSIISMCRQVLEQMPIFED